MRLLPTSLSARLVGTVVALVAVVGILVTVATTVAMSSVLTRRLDEQVDGAVGRALHDYNEGYAHQYDNGPPPPADGGGPRDLGDTRGQGVGTLTATFGGDRRGFVITDAGGLRQLSGSALTDLSDVPADGQAHTVDLSSLGGYRVKAMSTPEGPIVAGLSTHDIDETVRNLVAYGLSLSLAGVALAAAAGTWLVRRQLRPLREVAATAHEVTQLPLSTGEIGTTVRVPDDLTDERTEVGQVGAALNTMLAHVEHALDERHRSELQIRQFVADASHELRTPLTTIHGYAELSRRRPDDAARLALAMQKVEAAAQRMSGLVEDLLLLARLDAGRPLAREEVDLTKLVLEAVGDARVVGPDHRWMLDLPEEPVVVPGDEQRLHQVVTNLLNNARRHTPPGTTVTVGARPDDGLAVLTVQDDGPGMPPDLMRRAFERFTRGDSSRTRESGGAGLGLSLVEAISEAHGGSVSVDSAPGRTRFEVRLPSPV